MPKYAEMRVPCDREVWAKRSHFYIVEGERLVKMSNSFRAVLRKNYLGGDHFNNAHRTTVSVSVEGIVDGHDDWAFERTDWIVEIGTAYADFAAKNAVKLDGIRAHLRRFTEEGDYGYTIHGCWVSVTTVTRFDGVHTKYGDCEKINATGECQSFEKGGDFSNWRKDARGFIDVVAVIAGAILVVTLFAWWAV